MWSLHWEKEYEHSEFSEMCLHQKQMQEYDGLIEVRPQPIVASNGGAAFTQTAILTLESIPRADLRGVFYAGSQYYE